MDTSALMDAWVRYYPRESFPSLWDRMEVAADSAVLIAPDEVLKDLQRKDDKLYQWAKARTNMFVPLDEDVQRKVRQILAKFPRLIDSRKGLSESDPFVIAVAILREIPVVTGEKGGTPEKPKIPSVCQYYNLRCIDVVRLIHELGWTF